MPLSNLIGLLMTNQEKSVTFEHLASHLLKVKLMCYRGYNSLHFFSMNFVWFPFADCQRPS